jgi:hypothetical protein
MGKWEDPSVFLSWERLWDHYSRYARTALIPPTEHFVGIDPLKVAAACL